MDREVFVRAPAKVNLHLRVFGRRDDGFHGIRSIFQAISLADDMVVSSLKQPERIEIDGVFDCPSEETTFHKAALAFREATGHMGGLSVKVTKRIPAGAGLGGGSSDAASFLWAIDQLLETRLGPARLLEIGARVGSDVPFFLKGGAALVAGRGEIVESIAPREDFSLVVVFPGFPVSTADAYSLLDRDRPDGSCEPDLPNHELEKAYRLQPESWPFANSFEPYVSRVHPGIAQWITRLRGLGSDFAMMSGSGSTVFGVFRDSDLAKRAVAELRALAEPETMVVQAFPLACAPSVI